MHICMPFHTNCMKNTVCAVMGFHGTSHRYVSQRVCEFLGVDPKGKKIITCHIGNGGSISAIKDGKCIDTSMGLTPLEGLVMGARSGDIDAGAVTFIMEKEGLNATGVSNLLNKKKWCIRRFRCIQRYARTGSRCCCRKSESYFG